MFCSEEGGGEPVAKKAKVDDSLDGGMKDIAKAKVTEVTRCIHTHISSVNSCKIYVWEFHEMGHIGTVRHENTLICK